MFNTFQEFPFRNKMCSNIKFYFHREIFELDNYSPIPVETEEEYKLVTSRFPFYDAKIEKVRDLNILYFWNIYNIIFQCLLVEPTYRNVLLWVNGNNDDTTFAPV